VLKRTPRNRGELSAMTKNLKGESNVKL